MSRVNLLMKNILGCRRIAVVGYVLVIAGCGGGGAGGGDQNTGPTKSSIIISPHALTLNVGGSSPLTAVAIDASGHSSTTGMTWVSRTPAIASVDNSGLVSGFTVGITTVVASANGAADSIAVIVLDKITLQLLPATASTKVGGTVAFTAIAHNGAGQTVATPAITWSSSSGTVASVNGSGLATGLSKGTTTITAAATGATSGSAALTVTDASTNLACDGIASVASFDGTLSYDYAVNGTTNGGFAINSEYHGSLKATLAHVPGGVGFETWSGPISGTGTLHEVQSDPTTPGKSTKLDASGPTLTVAGPPPVIPMMNLIVNVSTCTYQVTALTMQNVIRTETNGSTSSSVTPLATVNVGSASALGSWKSFGISDLASGVQFDGHSAVWAVSHLDKNSFTPLLFAAQLLAGNAQEAAVGAANVSFQLTPK